MKEAMWAVGILVLCLFGLVLVNLFGNITVTDQLNYTTMRNVVEASMYDALDVAHYRTGFCLCTNKQKNEEGKWVFSSSNEYKLIDIQFDENNQEKCELVGYSNCEILHGEYRIKPKTFSESLVRRFAEMVNNNKDYSIVIQDIIEYPPKVSVKIVSKDAEYSPTEENSDGYVITNEIDGIIETYKDSTPAPTLTSMIEQTPEPTPTNTALPQKCKVEIKHITVGEDNTEKEIADKYINADFQCGEILEVDINRHKEPDELKVGYKDSYAWDGKKPKDQNGRTRAADSEITVNSDIILTYYYKPINVKISVNHYVIEYKKDSSGKEVATPKTNKVKKTDIITANIGDTFTVGDGKDIHPYASNRLRNDVTPSYRNKYIWNEEAPVIVGNNVEIKNGEIAVTDSAKEGITLNYYYYTVKVKVKHLYKKNNEKVHADEEFNLKKGDKIKICGLTSDVQVHPYSASDFLAEFKNKYKNKNINWDGNKPIRSSTNAELSVNNQDQYTVVKADRTGIVLTYYYNDVEKISTSCKWHFINSEISCSYKGNDTYETDCALQASCKSGYYSTGSKECPGTSMEKWTCQSINKVTKYLTFTERYLGDTEKRSNPGAYATKEAALKACTDLAKSRCNNLNGTIYNNKAYNSDECKAVQNYKVTGTLTDGTPATCKVLVDQESPPTGCPDGYKSCDIVCWYKDVC